MEFANSCFDTLVGLSSRDCDCFDTGRPEGSEETQTTFGRWEYESFTCPGDQVDPWTITTAYTLPADISAKVQLFAAGQLLDAGIDFEKTSGTTLSVLTPVAGAVYQIWYEALITTYETIPAYNVSGSGLYISDLMPEEEIAGLQACDETVWTLYQRAREIAIKDFVRDLNVSLQRRFKTRFPTWKDFIGNKKYEGRLTSSSAYAGVRIRTNGLRSGYLKITKIITLFEESGTLALTIYDQDGAVVTPQFNVTTTAGAKSVTSVNILLPLRDDMTDEQDYYIVYEYDSGNKGALNKLYCAPCNAGLRFSPTLNVETYSLSGPNLPGNHAQAWHNFFAMGGWEGDSVTDFSNSSDEMSQYLNGLGFEIETGCDMNAGLCSVVSGFDGNPWAMSAATAIQYRAAAWLVERRTNTSIVKRQNTVNKETILNAAEKWEGQYAEILTYLASNVPETVNDCLECKPKMRMQGITT